VPHRASNILDSLRAWMEKNNRATTVVLRFMFGAFFIAKGFSAP
jgi:hypothetical protein